VNRCAGVQHGLVTTCNVGVDFETMTVLSNQSESPVSWGLSLSHAGCCGADRLSKILPMFLISARCEFILKPSAGTISDIIHV